MNFMVVGLGSMGKRRVRLLNQYIEKEVPAIDRDNWSVCGVDSNRDRCEEAEKLHNIRSFDSISSALENQKVEAAVISTSPLSHAKIIKECLEQNLHVFTEINLVPDGYDENIKLAEGKKKVLFLSSTPIYRREMQYIINEASERGFKGTYRYHIGQYLPDWHPWESYKDFFVGDKRTNGCREIFAIELPWLTKAYGEIEDVYSVHNKATDLAIDYDDTYQVLIKHSSGVVGSMTVDVSTPKTERRFEAWEENYYIEWTGTPDSLKKIKPEDKSLETIDLYEDIEHVEGYNSFVVENAYYDELAAFIGVVSGNSDKVHSFEDDRKILDMIDRIER